MKSLIFFGVGGLTDWSIDNCKTGTQRVSSVRRIVRLFGKHIDGNFWSNTSGLCSAGAASNAAHAAYD